MELKRYVVIGMLIAGPPAIAIADDTAHVSRSGTHSTDRAGLARGVVFLDRNENGERERWERGIRGVSVSNGIDVVQTDAHGRYAIQLPPESILFVTKPADFGVPVDENNLPQFYYVHYPDGTPPVADFEYPVIAPTGALPDSVDFPLLPFKAKPWFKAMAFADPQAGTDEQQDMVREDVVDELIGNPHDAALGITVGDVVNDTLSLYERHNRMMAQIGIPMWNLPGNHDINFDAPNDRYSTETFKSVFGPTYYSFDYGDVHFVALDNIEYKGADQGTFDNTVYRGYVSEEQLEWLRNDLAHVPKHKLLVIATHISLVTYALDGQGERFALGDNINTVNLHELLDIIEPFQRVYAIAGHDTSNSWKVEVNHTHNWHGYPFIAHTLAEVRGNGWSSGPRDARGVRAATMQDGNPNGYYVISFRGTEFQPRFVPASGNPAESMRIVLDPLLDGSVDSLGNIVALNRGRLLPGTKLVVNVFDGGERDSVQMSLDGGSYVEMANVLRNDPFMERRFERFAGTPDAFSSPVPSSHIWEHVLPDDLAPGLHAVRVIAIDEFDQFAEASFTFELEQP